MRYYRNAELAKLYGVSEKSVRNWINSARKEKIELQLFAQNGKEYIAETIANNRQIEKLATQGRKYRNSRSHKTVHPTPEFVETYNEGEIVDIAHNLSLSRELPPQYRYHTAGGKYWDKYLHKLFDAGRGNTLTGTISLLRLNLNYIDNLIEDFDRVNVIDIGVGNGLAIREFLDHLKEAQKLNKYIGVDCSQELLDITERNIDAWFRGTIPVEKYVRDITWQRLIDIAHLDKTEDSKSKTLNVFLFLGGTLVNFREPLQALYTIQDSMGPDDILLTSLKADSPSSRRFFDFHIEGDFSSSLPTHDIHALSLLGIDQSMYEAEMFFDKEDLCRYIQVHLKVGVTIKFEVEQFRKSIELPKGERVLLWRAWHYGPFELLELFKRADFANLQVMTTKEQDCLLVISKARRRVNKPPCPTR